MNDAVNSSAHPFSPDVSFDGGELDCGNGLLLLIRKHIDPMARGQLLEIRSTEISVEEDLPAWCRLTANDLVSFVKDGKQRSFLVCKGKFEERSKVEARPTSSAMVPALHTQTAATAGPIQRRPVPVIPPLAVTGIGSWPRPRWMVDAMHAYVEDRLDEAAFHQTADDAVRLAAAAQERAGVDIVTDGEQRRDSYASFVATRLDNCQLIPLTDLLPLVDDPEEFERELRALDVPAADVRHPAVFGRISRSRPLALHEFDFLSTITTKPIKIALPGPYLLTRTMWMECLQERAYQSREELAQDVVTALRAELASLIEAGVALVQLDEPVLSEVVFSGPKSRPSFMCGALSESRGPEHELGFARDLVNAVVEGMPRERIALHVCRGNWTPDESVALTGSYEPLLHTLKAMKVGAYLLEMCTPRAGEMDLRAHCRRMPVSVSASSTRNARRWRAATMSSSGSGGRSICSAPSVCCCTPIAALPPSPTIRSALPSPRKPSLHGLRRRPCVCAAIERRAIPLIGVHFALTWLAARLILVFWFDMGEPAWAMYEKTSDKLISREKFIRRVAKHIFYVLAILGLSILAGAIGFAVFEGHGLEDAILHSAYVLSGLGLIQVPASFSGKLFAGLYGLYASLIFLAAFSVIFAPVVHRILHKLHLDDEQAGRQ